MVFIWQVCEIPSTSFSDLAAFSTVENPDMVVALLKVWESCLLFHAFSHSLFVGIYSRNLYNGWLHISCFTSLLY